MIFLALLFVLTNSASAQLRLRWFYSKASGNIYYKTMTLRRSLKGLSKGILTYCSV